MSPMALPDRSPPTERYEPGKPPAVTLYAELLLNIRTLTIFASLRSAHNAWTKAELSNDASQITVSHEGESATIRLPAKIKSAGGVGGPKANPVLQIPVHPPSKELTFRLQTEDEGNGIARGCPTQTDAANPVPWDGMQLVKMNHIRILCTKCQSALIRTAPGVGQWKDLPNENWAEMMDFWHCHKPDEHHLHGHGHGGTNGALDSKGYAAGNKLCAQSGVGFVDVISLLLHEDDCLGIKKQENTDEKQQPASTATRTDTVLLCTNCSAPIGLEDDLNDGFRLWKWAISIASADVSQSAAAPRPHSFSLQKWIAARLLSLIENQGVRKFRVHAGSGHGSDNVPSLFVWVFTPELFFSTSRPLEAQDEGGADPQLPTRAMKLFWQEERIQAPPDGGNRPGAESTSVEEVILPAWVLVELRNSLERNQTLLPAQARQFQGWQVGLLPRFSSQEAYQEDTRADDAT